MSAITALTRGRAAALALMVDTCVIRRVTYTSDPVTGVQSPANTQLYFGKCRIQSQSGGSFARHADSGEARRLLVRLEVQLPMTVTGLATEDQVTVLTSPNDPDLVNRVFRIHDLMHKTHATARRIGVEEITS